MNFDDWLKSVPSAITADPLWKLRVYQLSLFVADICWFDVTRLITDKRTMSLGDQLYRAVGSISANLAEGYSHGTGPNRARYYEYALGSARESRGWYFKARHVLGLEIATHRMDSIARIIQLLMVIVPKERGKTIREDKETYAMTKDASDIDFEVLPLLDVLTSSVPL